MLLHGAAVADADDDALGHRVPQRAVQRELLTLVQRGGGLVEEHGARLRQQDARERDALLLAR
jgi:hypothetical protein